MLSLTKKTGFYILIPSSLFLLISVYKKKYVKELLVSTVFTIIAFSFIWSRVVLPMWNIEKGEQAEIMSVPSQQIAYYIKRCREDISDQDWTILSSVYNNPEELADVYIPIRADHTKAHWLNDAPAHSKINFFKYYAKLYIQHPNVMSEAFLAQIYPLLCIDTLTMDDESLIFYRDNIMASDGSGSQQEEIFASWSNAPTTASDIHKLIGSSYKSITLKKISTIFDSLLLNIESSFAVCFSKVLFAVWTPLIILGYAIYKKSAKTAVALIPFIMNTVSLVLGPIILPRYMVNSLYALPIVICLPFIFDSRDKVVNQPKGASSIPD